MSLKFFKRSIFAGLFMLMSSSLFAHGLVVNPPARNANCGVDEKPDNATSADCIAAFAEDFNGGYQFMSVLTHDVGRQGVTPLPNNVCGFDSETWDNYNNGSTTPWDRPGIQDNSMLFGIFSGDHTLMILKSLFLTSLSQIFNIKKVLH